MASKAPPADAPNPGIDQIIGDSSSNETQTATTDPQSIPAAFTQLRRDATQPPRKQTALKIPSSATAVPKLRALSQSFAAQLRKDAISGTQPPRQPPPSEKTVNTRTNMQPPDHMTQLKRDMPKTSQAPPSISSAHIIQLKRDRTSMAPINENLPSTSKQPPKSASKIFPPGSKSVLRTAHDLTMASRQTMINKLSNVERKEQDAWARQKISEMPDACPQKYAYSRRGDGYVCGGGSHFITVELIAEGMGGMYAIKGADDWENRSDGPYYVAKTDEDGTLWFQKVVG